MKSCYSGFLVVGTMLAAVATLAPANDAKDEAIKKDRKQIEGVWQVVALEVNGKQVSKEDVKALTVVNGADGAWSLRDKGRETSKGVSTIDPTKKPMTIDFTPTIGDNKGKRHLGIYELGKQTRKLCFAPAGQARPREFSSPPAAGTPS
jgi:uncharacterized protein (TIGR03067 family)